MARACHNKSDVLNNFTPDVNYISMISRILIRDRDNVIERSITYETQSPHFNRTLTQ